MTDVPERRRGSRRRPVVNSVLASGRDTKALQLRAAIEILAEVFGTNISDVRSMLEQRRGEMARWPQEFYLER